MLALRPYQIEAAAAVRELESWGRAAVCVQSPTGSGKTIILADLLRDDVPQLVVTHRKILCDQLSRVLTKLGIEHGIRAAGHVPNPNARVQISMLQSDYIRSIKSGRWKLHAGCARVHIDEIHTVKATMATALLAAYPNASVVGWTATPRSIGHICKQQVVAATVRQLIADDFLVPPVVFTPSGPDLKRLQVLRANASGDYSEKDVDAIMPRDIIFGHVHDHLLALNADLKPTALFAAGVKSSLWWAKRLTDAGIPSAHIDGKQIWWAGQLVDSDPKNRDILFDRIRAGECKVVSSRFVLREGFDLPAIAHIILATSFGSRAAWVQSCGRGLRPSPGKTECIIQDHGANAWRFPALESDEPWDMDDDGSTAQKCREEGFKDETPKEPEPIVCPQCSCLRTSGAVCPNCSYRSEMSSRSVIQMDGTLVRVDGRYFQPRPPSRDEEDGDMKRWKAAFWSARKYMPNKTLRWAYTNDARKHNWNWLPRTLPLMPPDDKQELWGAKASKVDLTELR